jgi:CDP-4-dehydro-6-deoxyglucose reductase/ferredoxin-NAD(P)+ reductase (naphthalene dioxygenase ferredoxin-specific)
MPVIHVENWPQPIEAGRLRILEAALDAGVPYPHGCGSGECGGCKSELLAGEVTLDAYSRDALSDAERARGVILACRARLKSDVTVRWLSAVQPLPMVMLNARVQEIEAVAHDVVVLKLVLPQGVAFAFRPGQYAKLRMGKLPTRSFSMANQPGDGRLEFHIRVLPDGMVSGFIAEQLQVGQTVEVRGPFGDAHWEDQPGHAAEPLLLLAGGTGLAPMVSVLDAALRSGVPGRSIHLYHGVRGVRDLYARAHLTARAQRQGFRFVPVFSGEGVAAERSGMLHEAMAEDFSNLAATRIFVAGPPPMVDAVKAQAMRLGAQPSRIRADGFYAAVPEKKSLWERVTAWGDL